MDDCGCGYGLLELEYREDVFIPALYDISISIFDLLLPYILCLSKSRSIEGCSSVKRREIIIICMKHPVAQYGMKCLM
jgi:hypothetical protein